ncbi:MAG: hypothetical protein IKN43_07290 [Selenomonadaceae bacterium]|nr:hypothetical protein [Selenomonadaceae bacterium]
MKQFRLVTAITAVFMFLFMAATFAAPKDDLNASFKAMENVKSARGEVVAKVKFMGGTYEATSTFDLSLKPILFGNGVMQLKAPDDKTNQISVNNYEFYLDEDNKDFTLYYAEKGKNDWSKITTKKDATPNEISAEDIKAMKDFHSLDNEFVTVSYGQTKKPNTKTYDLMLDTGAMLSLVASVAKTNAKPEEASNLEALEQFAKTMSPIKYVITIPKENNEIECFLDLTPTVREIGAAVLKSETIEPMTKAMINVALNDAEVTINFKGTKFDKAAAKKVSDNVKKNAKESSAKNNDNKTNEQ